MSVQTVTEAVKGGLRPGCGQWLMARLAEVRSQLRADCEKAKAVLSASIRDGIRLVPDVLGYRVTIAWELLGATLARAGGEAPIVAVRRLPVLPMPVRFEWRAAA